MKLERTKNSIRNIVWGVLNKIIVLLFPFAVRTIIIKQLGAEYAGVNSLFSSILSVLNLAELGFSSAIVFNMYEPIANGDRDTICALMNFYRKVYRMVGLTIGSAGLILIPFLPYLVKGDYPSDLNQYVLYILFLLNAVASYYFLAYRNCILSAFQREDVVSKINIVLKSMMYIAQIIVLVYLRNYYIYLVCMILNTILTNIVSAYYAKFYYPEYECSGDLSPQKRITIKYNIKGLMIGKICLVSRNSFDSIFLSAFLGLKTVAIYGNYYYIMNAINAILIILMTSISAGVGNSIATESVEKNNHDMKVFIFLYAWIAGWCTSCLLVLYQPFIELWMGKDMLFPMIDVVLICLYFYSLSTGQVRSQYASSAGLFWENRKYVLTEAITNIILNYILGKKFGVHGIITATIISIVLINFLWGAAVLYKHYFIGYKVTEFYTIHLLYFGITVFATSITYVISRSIILENLYAVLLIDMGICCVVPNAVLWLCYHKTSIYKDSLIFIKRISNLRG